MNWGKTGDRHVPSGADVENGSRDGNMRLGTTPTAADSNRAGAEDGLEQGFDDVSASRRGHPISSLFIRSPAPIKLALHTTQPTRLLQL